MGVFDVIAVKMLYIGHNNTHPGFLHLMRPQRSVNGQYTKTAGPTI